MTVQINTIQTPAVVRAIGNSPLLELDRFAGYFGLPPNVELWLKAEWTNPGGSIKDRPALEIVRTALESSELGEGKVLLDATSGNTGIAYAMLGAAFGFPVELVMPENASEERKATMKAYGASVVYSDPYEGSNGAIWLAQELASTRPDRYYYADQYGNPANPLAHRKSTGPEIWRQSDGRITHFVASLGTTGSMMGVGSYLKAKRQHIRLVAVQPAEPFHGIEGLKHLPTSVIPSIYVDSVPDEKAGVTTERAYEMARKLASIEGLFAGTSTGAALAAAIDLARSLPFSETPFVLVVLAPDGGGRYLSTELWR